jgi:tetratricopeptide (TPR) repeat protein
MKNFSLTLFLVLCVFAKVWAQDKITARSASDIIAKAVLNVQFFPTVLNTIADSTIESSYITDVEKNSYTPKDKRQFVFDNKATIEDDIDPKSGLDNIKNLDIQKYYNELDLQYEKSSDESIEFTNFSHSNIKKNKDFMFVLVKFDSRFKNKNRASKTDYPLKSRVALVRVINEGGKWSAFISTIQFFDPAHPIDSVNDIPIFLTDSTSTIVSQAELNTQIAISLKEKDLESKQNSALFKRYVAKGDSDLAAKRYADARDAYKTAQEKDQLDISIDRKIREAERLIFENTYDNLIRKGDQAKDEQRYSIATKYYQQAMNQYPEKASLISGKKQALTEHLNAIASANSFLEAGSYDLAIKECEKKLKELKKSADKFPEFYYIQALAYQKQFETKIGDSHAEDNASKNFDLAIQTFSNYLDARIARANFYANVRSVRNYAGAVGDYDVLINNESDDSPDKPVHLATRAKFKDMANIPANALEDYSSAIKLSPKTDSLYFKKGELLYRLKRYDEATANFTTAIKLNNKYKKAYFYRGLNYYESKKYHLAGVDFAKLDTLAYQPPQSQTRDSLSNVFYQKAETLFGNHNYAAADSAYDIAIEIKQRNAEAWHGKAQICFVAAEALAAKPKPGDFKKGYQESIRLNKLAILYNRNFSDAHFKEGLAHNRIAEYDLAIKSYDEAVRSDKNNTQAFIEMGNTYQIQEKHAKAVESYNQAIALLIPSLEVAKKTGTKETIKGINNDLSNVYQLSGRSMYYLQQYPEAIIALNKAVDFNESNTEAYYYRGLVYEAKTEPELSSAVKDYNRAIKAAVRPNYKYFYANGLANFKNKNYDQSIENLNNLITYDSLSMIKNKYYLRGLSYFKNKAYDNALTDYAEYAKYEGAATDTAFYSDYGITALYAKQDSLATKNFNTALKLTPNSATAHYGLGCAYAQAGQFDKALEEIEKAFIIQKLTKDEVKVNENVFLTTLKSDKVNSRRFSDMKKKYNY